MPRGIKNPDAIKYAGAVRVLRIDLITQPEDREWLRMLMDTEQRIANTVWETWLVEHVKRGTGKQIKRYLSIPKADRPKCSIQILDAELQKKIYQACCDECPEIDRHAMTVATNVLYGKIKNRKASNGSLPGSWAILLRHESLPSSTRPLPIPLSKAEAKLIPPAATGDKWQVEVSVFREIVDGKGRMRYATFPIYLRNNRSAAQALSKLAKIKSGEWKQCNISLCYDKKNRRWSAHIGYQRMAEAPLIDSEKVAFIHACHNDAQAPWRLRLPSDKQIRYRGGDCTEIAAMRLNLLTQRWSRQANYRFAGSANKGHGRKRALLPIEKLSERWKDFVKTHNQQRAAATVRECVQANIGTLVYFQPTGRMADSRKLAMAGKVQDRHDSSSWDWYQFGTHLASACELAGVKFVRRKSASGEVREVKVMGKTAKKPKGAKSPKETARKVQRKVLA